MCAFCSLSYQKRVRGTDQECKTVMIKKMTSWQFSIILTKQNLLTLVQILLLMWGFSCTNSKSIFWQAFFQVSVTWLRFLYQFFLVCIQLSWHGAHTTHYLSLAFLGGFRRREMKVLRCLCRTNSRSWPASSASGVPPLVSTTARCTAWASDTIEAHMPLPGAPTREH